MGFNSFWPVYKNLEDETLQLTKYINFSDDQLKVYSMNIADLIMKAAVEIEALSKELYKLNGGPDVFDNNGNQRNLLFDSDCINYLNNSWGLCNREVIVSCASFNFTNPQYKIIKPLKNAFRQGKKSAKWNRAYQAVKHDRRNNLSKGNIENLIHALGALYMLNIYYRNDVYEYGSILEPNNFFDNRLGSNLFAATFADASKVPISADDTINVIGSELKDKLSTALCVIKYTDEVWKRMHESIKLFNKKMYDSITKDPEFNKRIEERHRNTTDSEDNIIISVYNEMKIDYIRRNPPQRVDNDILRGNIEVILNKGQVIYKQGS